jgi:hypothetical protein
MSVRLRAGFNTRTRRLARLDASDGVANDDVDMQSNIDEEGAAPARRGEAARRRWTS